jgi:hypothetical protein
MKLDIIDRDIYLV